MSERVLNCPPKVAPPLFAMLEEELDAERVSAPARDLLLLSRVFRDDNTGEVLLFLRSPFAAPDEALRHLLY